jgi:hypothetical protein
MSQTVETANAGAEVSPVETGSVTSEQGFLLRRRAAFEAKAEKPEPKATETEAEEAAAPTEGGEEAKPAEATPGNDVLSKAKSGNLDDLSEEELGQLAKALGSKAVARFGELTAKRKAAEERAAALEAQLASRDSGNKSEPIANNPYASLKTSAELKAKEAELKQSIDVLEEIIEGADGLGAEDVIGTGPAGESYTKKQVREKLRAARKARDEFLPDIAQRLAKKERATAMRSELEANVRKQLPWLEDEKDERTQRYKAIIGDERLKRIEEVDPEIAAQMPFFMAHAANSMFARKPIAVDTAPLKPGKPTPPSNPGGGAAASSRPEESQTKREKETLARAKETRSERDWTAHRAAKFSKRKAL